VTYWITLIGLVEEGQAADQCLLSKKPSYVEQKKYASAATTLIDHERYSARKQRSTRHVMLCQPLPNQLPSPGWEERE